MNTTYDLPFFVYGTLRPGYGNSRIWGDVAHAEHDGAATVQGFRLVTSGAFPFAVRDLNSTSVGALVYPAPEYYEWVLRSFDQLEGVPHLYQRSIVIVETPVADVTAWMYTYDRKFDDGRRLVDVPGNDWRQFERMMMS